MTPTNVRLKQELHSVVQATIGCVFLSLVLAGIGGTIYKIISPDGWVAHAFGRSLSAGAAALGSVLIIGALAWFSRSWGDPHKRHFVSDLMVYGFALAGLVYVGQIFATGSF